MSHDDAPNMMRGSRGLSVNFSFLFLHSIRNLALSRPSARTTMSHGSHQSRREQASSLLSCCRSRVGDSRLHSTLTQGDKTTAAMSPAGLQPAR